MAFGEDITGLRAHGRLWTQTAATIFDERTQGRHTAPTRILWSHEEMLKNPGDREARDYFRKLFPPRLIRLMVESTNDRMRRKGVRWTINAGDMYQYLGMRLGMGLEPRKGGKEAYWRTASDREEFSQGSNFEKRTGVTYNKFKIIDQNLSFCPYHEGIREDEVCIHYITTLFNPLTPLPPFILQDDPWKEGRPIIDLFNECRQNIIVPGEFLCVDECFFSWRAVESHSHASALPHTSKNKTKPRGVGTECKSLCDGQSNIMLMLDLMEGKMRQGRKPFGGGGTGHVLRLCSPYFGSSRVVVADSAFSSVHTAVECLNHGIHFMGIVKTAHREFPKKFLRDKSNEYGRGGDKPRGAFLHYTSSHKITHNGQETVKPVFAHAWYDRKAKLIVSTCGTTLAGTDSERRRHKKKLEDGIWTTKSFVKTVPRTKLVEEMFNAFSKVDIHDHYRQGSLGLCRTWPTKRWYIRLFASVFGICVVDAFFAFRYENEERDMDFTTFWGKLALQLIDNDFLSTTRVTRGQDVDAEEVEVFIEPHQLIFRLSYFNPFSLLHINSLFL